MSGNRDKTVALVDPIWIGHHPTYFAQFAVSFLRQGARVVAVCPDPREARMEMVELAGEEKVAERVVFRTIDLGRQSFFKDRFEGDPVRTPLRWKRAANVLDEVEVTTGWTVDLVYFPYLDSYLRFLPVPAAPDILLGRKWSGLYLRNHHHGEADSLKQKLSLLGKGDALLRSELCIGYGVLDERFIPQMERFSGKEVSLVPDMANMLMPEEPVPLALEILRKAAGRKVIGIIGLERRKGILTLLKAAELSELRGLPYFFACCGRIVKGEFSEDEWKWIENLVKSSSNLHLDLEADRIHFQPVFNSVFSTFDVVWAAYENFPGSSNTLTKAAFFSIPSLASEGGCVGARVKAYDTGEAIPQGNVEKALEAIGRLADDPPAGRYAEFGETHSIRRLDQLLGELLDKL